MGAKGVRPHPPCGHLLPQAGEGSKREKDDLHSFSRLREKVAQSAG